jgi:demethylspheroidene O-methyltransferase
MNRASILHSQSFYCTYGSSLLIWGDRDAEPMAGAIGADEMRDACFGFYLPVMGRGRSRTADELTALLRAAGFHQVKIARTRMPLQTKLLIARP